MDSKTPAIAKKVAPPPDDETEAEAKPPRAKSPGILSTALSRAIVISAVLLCAVILTPLLVADRYALVNAGPAETARAFRIDKLTGAVSLCSATYCTPVAEKE